MNSKAIIISSHWTLNDDFFNWNLWVAPMQLELWDPGKDWKISSTAISSASCLSRKPVLIVSTVSTRITWQWWRLKLTRVSILESLPKFRATAPLAPILKLPNKVREVAVEVPHQSNGYLDIWISATSNKEGYLNFPHDIIYPGHTNSAVALVRTCSN